MENRPPFLYYRVMLPLEVSAPCRVRTLGRIHSQPYHSTPATKQGDAMLTVIVGGRGTATLDGRVRQMDVGEGMIGLVRGTESGVLMCDPESPYLHYYSRFRGDYALALVETIRSRIDEPFFRIPHTESYAYELQRHGRLARRDLPGSCGPEGLTVLMILESILQNVTEEHRPAASPGEFAGVLREYLVDHLAEPTDLSRIARDLGVSRSTLSRRCRDGCGASVQVLHRDVKLEWARELLVSTSAPIAEVAARVGIADAFYFSRVFARHTGVSPREFRRRGLRS